MDYAKTTVVIPTYNEAQNIEQMITTLKGLYPEINLLVVDDNSPDETAKIVEKMQFRFQGISLHKRARKLGLGSAYREAFDLLKSEPITYIIQMDCDFSHDPIELKNFLKILEQDHKALVIGSRYVNGIRILNWPIKRLCLSYFASLYSRVVAGVNCFDPTSGFVAFHKDALAKVPWHKMQSEGYFYQIEMKFHFQSQGYQLSEVPIIFTDRRVGNSKIGNSIVVEALFGVLKLFFKRVMFKLKLLS